jgi:cholest-4-en-3-one 26-monooxygenase
LRANPEALLLTAVDEILRWTTPVMYFRRTASRDIELHGTRIRENDPVVLFYISANYDDSAFAEPHRFDVGRAPNPHVTFGGGGPHFCLGAHLARLEIRVLLEELLATAGVIELVGLPERLRSSWMNGLKHLPVAFTPAAPDGEPVRR